MTTNSYDVDAYGGPELLTLAARHEATHAATESGAWSDAAIWDGNDVPGDGVAVLVDDGVTVTLATQQDVRLRTVRVDGTLRFDPEANTRLRADTIVVSKAGRLEIGTESTPVAPSVTAEIEFVAERPLTRPDDPRLVGRGLLVAGESEFHGTPKTTWDALDSHATADDASITLSGAGPAALPDHGWQVGDEVVFPDQDPYTESDLVMDNGEVVDLEDGDEIREVTGVDGDTVTLDAPLERDHVPPESGLDSYVLNLTRNVHIYSEADDHDEFGHVMFTSPGHSIAYLQCSDVGRTARHEAPVSNPLWQRGDSETPRLENQRARYPIHFHRTSAEAPASTVRGCSVRRTPGWAYVNHGSSVDFLESVSYRADDVGFVTEAGDETGSMRRNFALRSFGSGEEVDSRKGWTNAKANQMTDPPNNVDDFGHHGGGFWIHSPIVEVEDNVAAGHRAHGFFFHHRSLLERPLAGSEKLDGKHDMFPHLPAAALTEDEREFGRPGTEDPPVGDGWHEETSEYYFSSSCRLRTFDRNLAFGCGAGASFRSASFRNGNYRPDWAQLAEFTAYNIGEHYLEDGTAQGRFEDFESSGNVGIDHRYVGNLIHRNYRLIGDGNAGIGVNNNKTYTETWDVHDSVIRGWEYGFVPKRYSDDGHNEVLNTTFENDTDVLLPGQFPFSESGLYLSGNTYDGDDLVHWAEIGEPNMIPGRFVFQMGKVTWEERNLYHGWSDPNFVIVEEGDDERLGKMLNHDNGDRWQEQYLDGDDPAQVLPGATHQELYDQYGILFYGGMKDPADDDAHQPDTLSGSGGTYDSTPFFGPDRSDDATPTDEIWIDAATQMTFSGDHEVIAHGDGTYDDGTQIPNEQALETATDGTAVELRRDGFNPDLPVESDEGVAAVEFEVSRAGTYQVYTRHQQGSVPDGGSADANARFAIQVDGDGYRLHDGGDHGKGTIATTAAFTWGKHYLHFLTFDLTEGTHTIEIAGKGSDMRLDRVLICHETVPAAPLGKGKSPTDIA